MSLDRKQRSFRNWNALIFSLKLCELYCLNISFSYMRETLIKLIEAKFLHLKRYCIYAYSILWKEQLNSAFNTVWMIKDYYTQMIDSCAFHIQFLGKGEPTNFTSQIVFTFLKLKAMSWCFVLTNQHLKRKLRFRAKEKAPSHLGWKQNLRVWLTNKDATN